uniref:Uncharacterized protein n=1 Tax=Dicentrarchus labrax TaxID=13489 RepID=A0A8C4H0N3_DICLA
MHSWSVGHSHCPEGQLNGGVGQFCSSLMSRQSFSPSHNQLFGMHSLLLCSSDPSSQSGWPSHSHSSGMQKPSVWHWNSSLWQRPGPRVAPVFNYLQTPVPPLCVNLLFMMPVIPCLIIMFPPPSLFLISNTALVLVSAT